MDPEPESRKPAFMKRIGGPRAEPPSQDDKASSEETENGSVTKSNAETPNLGNSRSSPVCFLEDYPDW